MAIQLFKGRIHNGMFAQALNLLRKQVAVNGSMFHIDVTSGPTTGFDNPTATALTCTVANATDLNSSIALANDLQAKINTHLADGVAHVAADGTNGPNTTPVATNLATVQTLANALKVAMNAHFTQSGVHTVNDGTNTISATNATDQSSANTLLNAIKTAYNAHIQSAPAGSAIVMVAD